MEKDLTNLVKRLKPEIVSLIEKDRVRYPTTVESLLATLGRLEYIGDIPYSIYLQLVIHHRAAFGFPPESLFNCFLD